jgi:undecaprenyl-phosphate galactose phosphotransferase
MTPSLQGHDGALVSVHPLVAAASQPTEPRPDAGAHPLASVAARSGSDALSVAPSPLVASVWADQASGADIRGSRGFEVAKRTLDIVGSAAGLVLLAPLFAGIAALIKWEDGGPVIHRRRIVGRNGRAVAAYKFRTMIPDADGYLRQHPDLFAEYSVNVKLRRDPRVTRVGAVLRRTSLDELPQLVNVLRGEMSLVGPRMIHPSEQKRYGAFAAIRRQVRPGITGLWQVSGRQETSYAERVALDRLYLSQRSFWLDLSILARTVGVLLRRHGAY